MNTRFITGNLQFKHQTSYSAPVTGKMILFFILFLCLGVSGDAEAKDAPDLSLFAAARIDEASLKFCGEKAELDKSDARQRMEKAMLLALWDRPQVVLWIKRANRYFPIIEQKLKAHKMPEDLKYIALIESALRPHAGSSKGAIGFWQFTRSTGKKYGLKIDSEKDERRNIYKSTDAAIDYLKKLHDIFGSWTLTAAAYNMGEHGLRAEILVQKSDNFYELYLPLETQLYVFRILTAKLIMTQPRKYGFDFSKQDLYPPPAHKQFTIECFKKTPIALISAAADTSFKVIKDLNPELRGHYLFPGQHSIFLPEGSGEDFKSRLNILVNSWHQDRKDRVYIVQKGDNLSSIAKRFNIPLPVLIIWNNLDYRENIHPGDRLIIHPYKNELQYHSE